MKHLFKFIILINFFFVFNVKAIKCSYNVMNDCDVIISSEDGKNLLKTISGSNLKCNDLHFNFNLNESYFIKNGSFECPKLLVGNFTTQARDSGYMLSTKDRHNYAHGTSPVTLVPTIIEDTTPPKSPDTTDQPSSSTSSRNPYDDLELCDENSNDYIVACACMPAAVADITSFIYGFLKIGGPVLLIILGAIDLGKAIVATDESGIQKAKKKLVNKFVAAASIFLVFSIVQMIVSIVGGEGYVQQTEGNCLYYLLNGYNP